MRDALIAIAALLLTAGIGAVWYQRWRSRRTAARQLRQKREQLAKRLGETRRREAELERDDADAEAAAEKARTQAKLLEGELAEVDQQLRDLAGKYPLRMLLLAAVLTLLFQSAAEPLYGSNGSRLEALPSAPPERSALAEGAPDPCNLEGSSLEGLAQALEGAGASELLADGAAGLRLQALKIGKLCQLLQAREAELAAVRRSLDLRSALLQLKTQDLDAYREYVAETDTLIPLLKPSRLNCAVGIGGSVSFAGADAAAGISLTCGVVLF